MSAADPERVSPPPENPSEVGVSQPPAGGRSRLGLALRAAGLTLVVLFLALLAWATLVPGRGDRLVARVAAGEAPPAPEFDLEVVWPRLDTWPPGSAPLVSDRRLSLDELRQRPVVINFWASWCIPCRDEAPILNASARAHRGEVVFVGIDVKDFRSDALGFLREFDVPYVALRDHNDSTYDDFGLTGVPETYYLDARGRIISHAPGAITRESLEIGIRAALRGTP